MAFSSILRRSALSLASLAVRALRRQRNCRSAIFTALNQTSIVSKEPRLGPFLSPPRSYSTESPSSDDSLLRFFDSEIQRAKEIVDRDRGEHREAPVGFPFKIEDDPAFVAITLSREYQGEQIKVEVGMPDPVVVTSVDEEFYYDGTWRIPLVVSVAKGKGRFIKFHCTAGLDELVIDRLAVKNPDNSEDQIVYEGGFHENQQEEFEKYLAIRGIRVSTVKFLIEYMISRNPRGRLMWLKNLKKFVEA